MSEQERMCLEKQLYKVGLCLPFVAGIFYAGFLLLPENVTDLFRMPCVFHAVTGLYCPGCGGTRAVEALFQGEIVLSFIYHPVVLYGAGVYLWFMVSHTVEFLSGHRIRIGMRYRNVYLYLALLIVIVNIAVKDIALTAFHFDILKSLDDAHALV